MNCDEPHVQLLSSFLIIVWESLLDPIAADFCGSHSPSCLLVIDLCVLHRFGSGNGFWNSARTYNRIGTSLSNNNYGHTFAGIGIHHEHGLGSYVTKVESAPISAYCDLRVGYGDGTIWSGGYHHPNSGCTSSFRYVDVNHAIWIR